MNKSINFYFNENKSLDNILENYIIDSISELENDEFKI